MKKRRFITAGAVIAILMVTGCKQTEENRGAEATKPPAEAVTDALSQEREETPLTESVGDGSAQEDNSSGVRFSFREETEEEKNGEFVYFTSTLHYPVFEGKNADVMNRFVETLTEEFREALPDAKESAKYDYEDAVSGEYMVSIFPEKEELIVNCQWETEQYITLFSQYISSSGGVHPNVLCQAYVIDVTKGEAEALEKMLEGYGVTTESVVAYATEKIRTAHGENLYSYDNADALEKDVKRLIQNNQWYFNDKGLVLFANPYEIAAYAYGMVECVISYEELEQGLKK